MNIFYDYLWQYVVLEYIFFNYLDKVYQINFPKVIEKILILI